MLLLSLPCFESTEAILSSGHGQGTMESEVDEFDQHWQATSSIVSVDPDTWSVLKKGPLVPGCLLHIGDEILPSCQFFGGL